MSAETLTTHQERLVSAYSSRFENAFLRRVKDGPISSFFQWLQSIGATRLGQLDIDGINGGGDKAARINVTTATGNSVSSYTSGDPRPTGGTLTDYTATHEWRPMWGAAHMRGDLFRRAVAAAMWNQSSAWADKMETLLDDIVDTVDSQLIGSGGSGAIDGLGAIYADTNTYAGIDRTAVANWKPYKKDAGAAAVTKALLDDVHKVLSDTRRVAYDVILCGCTQFQKLEDIIDGRRRDATDIAPATIMYRGRPIIELAGLSDTEIYFARQRNFALPFETYPDGQIAPGVSTPLQRGLTAKGLPFGLFLESDGSDGINLTAAVSANLVYRNTWEAGYLTNLA